MHRDRIYGSAGDDNLQGGSGDDRIISGGDGADAIKGGTGEDIITGGKGDDVIHVADAQPRLGRLRLRARTRSTWRRTRPRATRWSTARRSCRCRRS